MIFYKHFNEKEEEIMIPIYDNSFYTICPVCGREEQLEDGAVGGLATAGELESVTFYCATCLPTVKDEGGE